MTKLQFFITPKRNLLQIAGSPKITAGQMFEL
jgi:hypothetical protein